MSLASFYSFVAALFLLKLLQEILGLEIVWDGFVVTSDYFVNLFFPGRLRVPAHLEGIEKFAQRCFYYRAKMVWNLKIKRDGLLKVMLNLALEENM